MVLDSASLTKMKISTFKRAIFQEDFRRNALCVLQYVVFASINTNISFLKEKKRRIVILRHSLKKKWGFATQLVAASK